MKCAELNHQYTKQLKLGTCVLERCQLKAVHSPNKFFHLEKKGPNHKIVREVSDYGKCLYLIAFNNFDKSTYIDNEIPETDPATTAPNPSQPAVF